MKIINIVWDTDGEDVDLPNEVLLVVDDVDEVADALSDAFGWCVSSFDVE